MIPSPRHALQAALILAATMAAPLAAAPNPTPPEVDILPPWCHNYGETLTASRPVRDPMVQAQLAKFRRTGCSGLHHYCWALVWLNRAVLNNLSGQDRAFALSEAVADTGYSVKNSAPSCSLQPEMHAKLGEIHTMAGQYKEAEEAYAKAFRYQKHYPRAYIGIADLYELRGNRAKAIAVLQEGIKANPRSSALKRKLERVQERQKQGSAPVTPSTTE